MFEPSLEEGGRGGGEVGVEMFFDCYYDKFMQQMAVQHFFSLKLSDIFLPSF